MSDGSDRLTARIALKLKALTRQAAGAGLHQLAETGYVAASEAEISTERPHEYGTAPGEETHPPFDLPASAAREELVTQLEYLRDGRRPLRRRRAERSHLQADGALTVREPNEAGGRRARQPGRTATCES